MKKVSLVLPVYKVEQYIEGCLQSIYDQTYHNLEVIFVDDCTPDNSILVVDNFVSSHVLPEGMEIKVLHHQENRGISAARNTGIDAATGDYVFFLDSDDQLTPDAISLLVQPLDKQDYDFVIGSFEVVGSDHKYPPLHLKEGEVSGAAIFHNYAKKRFYMMAWGKLCNLSFIRNNGLYFQEGIVHEDDLWSCKVALAAQSMYAVKQPVYIYKIRGGSITTTEDSKKKLHNFFRVFSLINQEMEKARGRLSANDLQLFYDYNLRGKYFITFAHGLKEEYATMRSLDLRTYSHILLSSLKSLRYLKIHGHRLLPVNIGFSLYSLVSRHSDYN